MAGSAASQMRQAEASSSHPKGEADEGEAGAEIGVPTRCFLIQGDLQEWEEHPEKNEQATKISGFLRKIRNHRSIRRALKKEKLASNSKRGVRKETREDVDVTAKCMGKKAVSLKQEHQALQLKGKAIPATGRGGPTSSLPHSLCNRLTDDGKIVRALCARRPLPPGRFLVFISGRG
jgi:hypothetical protein